MPRYLYSETPPPFSHQIRCCPDPDVGHEDGVEWLHALDDTIDMMALQEGRDYERVNLTTLRFRQHHVAERFYNFAILGLGENLR